MFFAPLTAPFSI